MRIVTPQEVTADILTTTNVVNIESTWAAGTYSLGARAVYENEVYEVVASPSTTDQPDVGAVADPPTWVRIGWSNQWRMFRDGADSQSTRLDTIDVTLVFPQTITTLAALGLIGNAAQLTMTDIDDGVVYDRTISLVDIGVGDWWEYYFLPYESDDTALFDGIPPYPGATVRLLVSGIDITDPIAVGRVVAGIEREIGATLYGTEVQLQDYSIKERDGFGNLILVPRRTLKLVNYDVHVETQRVDFVVRALSRLSAMPTLFIGDNDRTSTITFGVYTDVSQGITTPSISDLTIQVEEF